MLKTLERTLSENGLEEKQHIRDFTARILSLLEEENVVDAHQKASEAPVISPRNWRAI